VIITSETKCGTHNSPHFYITRYNNLFWNKLFSTPNLNVNNFKFTADVFFFFSFFHFYSQGIVLRRAGVSEERFKCLNYLLFPGAFIAQ
jgi:hypothetical protein